MTEDFFVRGSLLLFSIMTPPKKSKRSAEARKFFFYYTTIDIQHDVLPYLNYQSHPIPSHYTSIFLFDPKTFINTSSYSMPPPQASTFQLLVCTANLGNAKPDGTSWDAWIPKNGQLVDPSMMVRMEPPGTAGGRPMATGANYNKRSSAGGRGGVMGGRGGGPGRGRGQQQQQQQDRSMNNNSHHSNASSNDSDGLSYEQWLEQQQQQCVSPDHEDKPNQHQPPDKTTDSYDLWLLQQQQQSQEPLSTKSDHNDDGNTRQRQYRQQSNTRPGTGPSGPGAPGTSGVVKRKTKSAPNPSSMEAAAAAALKRRPLVASTTTTATTKPNAVTASAAAQSLTQSMTKGASRGRPPPPQDEQLPRYGEGHFDLIVIGMQEATFEIKSSKEEKKKLEKKEKKKAKKDMKKIKEEMKKKRDEKPSPSSTRTTTTKSKSTPKKSVGKGSRNNIQVVPEEDEEEDNDEFAGYDDDDDRDELYNRSTDDDDDDDDSDSDINDVDSDEESLSDSDDEEKVMVLNEDGTITTMEEFNSMLLTRRSTDSLDSIDGDVMDAINNNPAAGPTKASKRFGITKSLTKSSKLAGKKLIKISKKTAKTAVKAADFAYKTLDAVDTYAGWAKDHTNRRVPSVVRNATKNNNGTNGDNQAANGVDDDDNIESGWTDTDTLHYRLETEQLPGYKRALSYQLGEMRMLIYVKLGSRGTSSIQSLDIESVKYQATGIGGMLANKGGIVAEVVLNKSTKLSFMSAHLEAHEGESHFQARCTMLQDIMTSCGHKYYNASESSHYSFAMGDLNFRTKLPGVGPERHLKLTHQMAYKKDFRILNEHDELRIALLQKKCMAGYNTPYCNFSPTFKVTRHEKGFKYNVKRTYRRW
jgi:hypothetical protein